jgi:hypothetical protein
VETFDEFKLFLSLRFKGRGWGLKGEIKINYSRWWNIHIGSKGKVKGAEVVDVERFIDYGYPDPPEWLYRTWVEK